MVAEVAELFELNRHKVDKSVKINHREIDIVAVELQGLIPKTFLIEVADYAVPVGVDKIQFDERKLSAAREDLKEGAVLVHVARNGYTAEAAGYARSKGLSALTINALVNNLINFTPYINAIEADKQKTLILREYQATTMFLEGGERNAFPSTMFLERWVKSDRNFLFVLGDYGVGKSWLLKRLLFGLLEKYQDDPSSNPLPILIPLQRFVKSFDFKNLILKVFDDYGLSGVHYEAFQFLMRSGRVVVLLDSFDEMAQSLSRTVIRDNLNALLEVSSGNSKIIMTSRPTYFENRSERILVVERFDATRTHQIDKAIFESQEAISKQVYTRLDASQFSRLNDLTTSQRTKLFKIVLAEKPRALEKLLGLLQRFSSLQHLSQRAVIARLLTTVAETLASTEVIVDVNGAPLLPDDLDKINQGKIFEIVIYNLLQRDVGFGDLSATERLRFLRAFAIYLQSPSADLFASPDEIREIVRSVFSNRLRHTDSPQQELEGLYRTCRRHSGLTTESQFYDTSGILDHPVSEADFDSRVGFSHNSLREFLVADSIIDAIGDGASPTWGNIIRASLTDVVLQFTYDITEYKKAPYGAIAAHYLSSPSGPVGEIIFQIICHFITKSTAHVALLGRPAEIRAQDLSFRSLAKCDLRASAISDCLVQETDFSGCELSKANFSGSIIERGKFDSATLTGADFTNANVISIFVYDEFDTKTSGILEGQRARQWLFSHGALVKDHDELNPLMGKPWYEAAREVTRTLQKRLVGTHQQASLAKGTDMRLRNFANAFVDFLLRKGVLVKVHKAKSGTGWVVRVDPEYFRVIEEFSDHGVVSPVIAAFFESGDKQP